MLFLFLLSASSAAVCAGSGPFQRLTHTLKSFSEPPFVPSLTQNPWKNSFLCGPSTLAPFGLSWPLCPSWCLYPSSSSHQQTRCSSVMPLIKKKLPIPTAMQRTTAIIWFFFLDFFFSHWSETVDCTVLWWKLWRAPSSLTTSEVSRLHFLAAEELTKGLLCQSFCSVLHTASWNVPLSNSWLCPVLLAGSAWLASN